MNPKLKIVLIIGAVFGFLGIILIAIILILTQVVFKKIDTITPTPTIAITSVFSPTPITSITVSPTSEAFTVTPPDGWQKIDNTQQHYFAYRPNGWYYRLFPPNMELLGIDPYPIPTASEYGGVITMARLTASNNYESYRDYLEPGFTETSQLISGRNWIIITGKTPANEIYDSLFIKYAYVIVDGKEFLAKLESGLADFGGQEANFDIFVQTINFY